MPYMPKDDSHVFHLSHDGHYVIDCNVLTVYCWS